MVSLSSSASDLSCSKIVGAPVQPRVCGERDPNVCEVCLGDGSAPRVRGTQRRGRVSVVGYRFSPACAGNAALPLILQLYLTVQPRVCGERSSRRSSDALRAGSAPRVRGTHRMAQSRGGADRFSPECAGNAAPSSRAARSQPVQPRVCGERRIQGHPGSSRDGSAPRVRGTPPSKRGCQVLPRFSPACVVLRRGLWICGSAPRVRGTLRLSLG